MQVNPNSHLTAKEREFMSFPAKHLHNKSLLKGEVLDFGCGFGKDVEILKEKGFSIQGYDKFYYPEYPNRKFDTILCIYVLNVLMPEEQALVLMEVSELLNPGGKAYFVVRRDLQFEGFRTHKLHQKKTYQCNVKLPFNSIFANDSCEIYEYQHYNQIPKTLNTNCPFCNPDSEREVIVESATAYAVLDKYPVNDGHVLIIPKRHVANYFDLTFKEQSACIFMLNKAKEIITKRFKPQGFNVGINIGEIAGQTVNHVHLHLIPRYTGDVEDPTGGVRGVVPNKQKY